MQLPNDTVHLCARCEKNQATESYTRSGHTELVCATCLDRWNVQDAYEGQLIHIITLSSQRQYDEALACLDAILEANRDRDHDRWLVRSIAAHRVMILSDAHRYAEAEQASEAQAQLGFGTVWQRYEYAYGAARIFEAGGRLQEAVAVIEDALRYQEIKELPSALGLLDRLTELLAKLGQRVDPKWQSLVEAAAVYYGVEVPTKASLGETILALNEMTREMEPAWDREAEEEEQALLASESTTPTPSD